MIKFYLSERTRNNSPFFDELASANGEVFPHWQKLVEAYDEMGDGRLDFRAKEIARQLRENGVTYNVYGDPDGMNRPWTLDPVPMIFSETDWSAIQAGLIQRTELLNYILKDIYGPRQLIRSGLIPFELIYYHQGFLRQMDKVKIPGDQQLIQYSADLARGPDGKMWVIHDRTDAPSGAGYTFENRVAMTRVFPEMIRHNHVRKISTYYQVLKNTLAGLAWHNKENPRVVVLSPGPGNETYFEHAYLASFLGYTLAIGEDLTVSDGFVWLKTIEGLEKVDVIVRRVDDIFCDPLEFRMDSHLGVVGLMEAIRQQKVLVINPLGCRVLENPGLMSFLPKLCRHIRNEDLILPSVASWWCGQPKELDYVLNNLKFLIIRRIYRSTDYKAVYGAELSDAELEVLKNKIILQPHLYVGQEMVNFSTTPSYINGNLESRNSLFRSYVVADRDAGSYYVMPGGLSRSAPDKGVFMISNQSGGLSKDTWIIGNNSKAVPKVQQHTELKQVRNVLPSRTAENLYWLGRYIERAIYTVRLFRIVLRKYYETDDSIQVSKDKTLYSLLNGLTAITSTETTFKPNESLLDIRNELIQLATDVNKSGSLSQSIQSFLSNSYAVRDRLSLDTWRILDTISEELNEIRKQNNLHGVYHNLDTIIIKLMAFHGLNIDNMTREPSWNILNVGRFLEASLKTCTILQTILVQKNDQETEKGLLENVLMCNESLVTYRYKFRSTLEVTSVLKLLMLDELNPKSVVYQVERISQHLERMPSNDIEYLNPIRKKLLEATTMIRLSDPKMLSAIHTSSSKRKDLNNFMSKIISLLSESSVLIGNHYFNHTSSSYGFVTSKLPEV